MQPDAQKRLRAASAIVFQRRGDQRAQAVQQANGFPFRLNAVRGERQAGSHSHRDSGQGQRAVRQRAQQVDEHQVPAQLLRQRDAPVHGVEIALYRRAEEQLVLRLQVALGIDVAGGIHARALRRQLPMLVPHLGIDVAGGIHARGEVRLGRDVGLDDGGAEQLVDALAFFAQDGVLVEGLAEHVRRVLAQSALLRSSPTVAEVPTQISPSPGDSCRGT